LTAGRIEVADEYNWLVQLKIFGIFTFNNRNVGFKSAIITRKNIDIFN